MSVERSRTVAVVTALLLFREAGCAAQDRPQPHISAAENAKGDSTAKISADFFPKEYEGQLWNELVTDACPTNWKDTVHIQLANWKDSGILIASLDKYCSRNSVRVSIVAGEIRVARWAPFKVRGNARIMFSLWLLQLAVLRSREKGVPFQDVELVLQGTDGAQSSVNEDQLWDDPGPLLGSIKCGTDGSVSFPMGFHDQFAMFNGAATLAMYNHKFNQHLLELEGGPWGKKNRSLYFSSGKVGGAAGRGSRAALFNLTDDPLFALVRGNRPLNDQAKFQYLVYAHGRCGWSRRIRELAFSRAAVFAEESACRE
jgi:hypothetical protein